MIIEVNTLFNDKRVKVSKLIAFGFVKNDNEYVYTTDLAGGHFRMIVKIRKNGEIFAEVADVRYEKTYLLNSASDIDLAEDILSECDRMLRGIAENCVEKDVFESEHAKQAIRHAMETYGSELEFLWPKSPKNAVFRRKDNAKWYAAFLTVKKEKIGLGGDGTVEIIDLRIRPEDTETLVDGKRFFPGYHMNKKHWFTICLDGSVPIEEIIKFIDESHELAKK